MTLFTLLLRGTGYLFSQRKVINIPWKTHSITRGAVQNRTRLLKLCISLKQHKGSYVPILYNMSHCAELKLRKQNNKQNKTSTKMDALNWRLFNKIKSILGVTCRSSSSWRILILSRSIWILWSLSFCCCCCCVVSALGKFNSPGCGVWGGRLCCDMAVLGVIWCWWFMTGGKKMLVRQNCALR